LPNPVAKRRRTRAKDGGIPMVRRGWRIMRAIVADA
jgi:hypothetical protein